MVIDFDHFVKRLVDEDDADQCSETFLWRKKCTRSSRCTDRGSERLTGKTRYVLNEITGVGNDHDEKDEGGPQADPTTKIHVIKIVISTVMTESRTVLFPLIGFSLAKMIDDRFEDEHGTRAAKNGQRLTGK